MFCTNCGNQVAENAVACMSCGMRPQGNKKFCGQCGKPVNENQVVCTHCGTGIVGAATPPPVHAPTEAPKVFCTNCGNSVTENAVACMSCGARPTGHKGFCRNCGVGVNPQQVVCVKCGSSLGAGSTQTRPPVSGLTAPLISGERKRMTAALLAILLGAFGVHKFYMGSWGWGAVFCAFTVCTCFYGSCVTGIIGIVEGIMLLQLSDEAFAAKYPIATQAPFRW